MKQSIQAFLDYHKRLTGYEKGEAQVFLDRLFIAFGHQGYKEAGAAIEKRVQAKGQATRFADLIWDGRCIIEMKGSGENLQKHFQQLRSYWERYYPQNKGGSKPPYCILCNFDEFWIYSFLTQSEPVDKVRVEELPKRWDAFGFMLADFRKPEFNNNTEQVSRDAADSVGAVLHSLLDRGIDRRDAQRFVLQCCFCMFAEDFELLPRNILTTILHECSERRGHIYDLIGGLFRQMASKKPAKAGRFAEVAYFNGGLFENAEPIEMNDSEVNLLYLAAKQDWTQIQPPIFGAIFEGSMDAAALCANVGETAARDEITVDGTQRTG